MRLLRLRDDGSFELTDHPEHNKIPEYAILSHTWLNDHEEVTFRDVAGGVAHLKTAGSHKIRFCGEQASKDGLHYFWVDTCCINKSSSAELQEAIASMFSWYCNASKCYVYMADVSVTSESAIDHSPSDNWESQFRSSKWFTRGWTLQELIAPASVEFFSAQGTYLGDKKSLETLIHTITGIPHQALRGQALGQFSVAERLSWAKHRRTKRKEDKAYSLLGIFSVFLPLIYGEGDHAFTRLEQEIEKTHTENAKFDRLLSQLPATPQAAFNSLENQHGPECLSNTRVEILQDITSWADGSDARCIYWLNGIAGTGKSTVARTVARIYHDRGNLGGSFFFSRGGGDVGLAEKLFTTLASQLAAKIPSAKRHICEAIQENQDIALCSLRDQWNQLILSPLSKVISRTTATILLVIDALDECDSERDIRVLLRLLTQTSSLENIRLRIFITSRPEIAIRCGFSQIPEAERQVFVLHEIQPTIVNRDLTLFFQNRFELIREERGLPVDWPAPRTIKRLVEISCGLFIWASTACRFVREGKLVKRRVEMLINDHRSGAGPEKQLDQIYITVLKVSIQQGYSDEEKAEAYDMLREVLGSFVILFSPLSMESLAHILDRPLDDIATTMSDLHTIFHIPSQSNRPLRPHHPTFRDFLLDRERCKDLDFWVDEKPAHKALADNCIRLMSDMLRRNICGLQSPGTLVKDIDPNLIQKCIPAELQYACLYWAQHYRQSGARLCDGDEVHHFFQQHFLHWLEAINLIGKGPQAAPIIRMYQSLLGSLDNPQQVPYCKDARRFIFAFHSILEQAPLQTYCSALAFIPPTNGLKNRFWSHIQHWMTDIRNAEALAAKVKDEYNYVNDIAFTPDGRLVASGTTSEIVRLWDVASKATRGTFEGQTDKVSSVAISPDGTKIASGSDDASVMVWDFKTRAVLYTLRGHSRWVNSVKFSPNGKLLASASMDETIRIADALKGEELEVFDGHSSCVNVVAFSPDSSLIASGSVDQLVRLWDLKKKEIRLILDGHSGVVNSVCFSPNGKQVLSGSDDKTCRVCDTVTGAECYVLRGHMKKVTAVTFSPDGQLMASGSDDKTVRLWVTNTGELLATLIGHTSGINAVTFSPDSRLLASGSFNDEIRLWDAMTGNARGTFDDFDEKPKFSSPLDQQLALTGLHEILSSESLDNVRSPFFCESLKGHSSTINCVVFSPNDQLIATGSQDGLIKLWAREGTERWKLEGHSGSINHLAFSPDSCLAASASIDRTVKLWNTSTGVISHTLVGHSNEVLRVAFSPDGRVLASCSCDKTAILWEAATGKELFTFASHEDTVTDITFSPDNTFIATCSADKTLKLWNIASDVITLAGTIKGHSESVNSVAFSPDSSLLVSSSADCTIRLWNTSGAALGILKGHHASVNSAAISPNNELVVSCSDDSTIKLWRLETKSEQSTFEFDVPTRRVAFSSSGQYIETDRGKLDIGSFPPSSPFERRPSLAGSCSHTLFATKEWIRRTTENILWLPPGYHATAVATSNGLVVLGHSSGSISFVYL
ncbi:hypothetical protein IFR05_008136 [Cadophora sp. M221]|nr:hypothetical protein IFR05_008136 [Cadophora sp. M221]